MTFVDEFEGIARESGFLEVLGDEFCYTPPGMPYPSSATKFSMYGILEPSASNRLGVIGYNPTLELPREYWGCVEGEGTIIFAVSDTVYKVQSIGPVIDQTFIVNLRAI
jgi:hypothetical protein